MRNSRIRLLLLLVTLTISCAHPQLVASNSGNIISNEVSNSSDAESCVFDFESMSLRECFHIMADGKCAHFGRVCTVEDVSTRNPCVFDEKAGSLRQCFHVMVDGKCAHYGPLCVIKYNK